MWPLAHSTGADTHQSEKDPHYFHVRMEDKPNLLICSSTPAGRTAEAAEGLVLDFSFPLWQLGQVAGSPLPGTTCRVTLWWWGSLLSGKQREGHCGDGIIPLWTWLEHERRHICMFSSLTSTAETWNGPNCQCCGSTMFVWGLGLIWSLPLLKPK